MCSLSLGGKSGLAVYAALLHLCSTWRGAFWETRSVLQSCTLFMPSSPFQSFSSFNIAAIFVSFFLGQKCFMLVPKGMFSSVFVLSPDYSNVIIGDGPKLALFIFGSCHCSSSFFLRSFLSKCPDARMTALCFLLKGKTSIFISLQL